MARSKWCRRGGSDQGMYTSKGWVWKGASCTDELSDQHQLRAQGMGGCGEVHDAKGLQGSLVELPVDVLLLLDDLLGVVHLAVHIVGLPNVPLLRLRLGDQLQRAAHIL